jgi:hypothetical protein
MCLFFVTLYWHKVIKPFLSLSTFFMLCSFFYLASDLTLSVRLNNQAKRMAFLQFIFGSEASEQLWKYHACRDIAKDNNIIKITL